MAKAKKVKEPKIESLSLIEHLQSLPVPSSEVTFNGYEFTVLHSLPIDTINLIVTLVTNNVLSNDEEGNLVYFPLLKDVVWDYCKVRYLTNIPLPEEMESGEVYDLVHRSGLIKGINDAIPSEFAEFVEGQIYEAISAKQYLIKQENNILNVLKSIITNMPDAEKIKEMAEQVKDFDFSQLNILKPEE